MILSNDYFIIPAFGASIFIITYLWSNRVIDFFKKKSLGNREEIIEVLDKMLLDIDKERVTLILLLGSVGLGIAVFLLCWPSVLLGIAFGLSVTLLGWRLPLILIKIAWERRCDRIVNQMVDGLTIMANGVRSGLSLTQCLERVCINMRGPLTQEFQLVLNKVRLGLSVEDALNEMGERIPRQDITMLVTGTNILKETGGNLGETFTTIVNVVRERQKIEKKIGAMTAQGVTQGVIITLVPFILMAIFLVVDPNYIMPLFTKPLGWVALAIMLALQIIGGYMMKKVVTIQV